MAPQLEASGAEPTLANCVQTALRILAAAPGMGSSRRPAYKGGFIHRGPRQPCWRLSPHSLQLSSYLPLGPDLATGPEKGSSLSRFPNLQRGGNGDNFQRENEFLSVLPSPPPPHFTEAQIPLSRHAGSPQRTAGISLLENLREPPSVSACQVTHKQSSGSLLVSPPK